MVNQKRKEKWSLIASANVELVDVNVYEWDIRV